MPVPLIRARALTRRVRALARRIAADHRGGDLVVLALMDGAFCFVADLARALDLPEVRLHFVRASSYGGAQLSAGRVDLGAIPELTRQRVLVVDDILDTGRTLKAAVGACAAAASVRTCVLLDKPARRASDGLPTADYVGFTIGDQFVVGYGLDHAGRWRHLPDVCTLPPPPAASAPP